jgi:transglutaminase-like putative cysteine protease
MKRRVAIQHRIEIDRGQPIDFPTYWARLRPAASRRISAYSLQVEPQPNFLNWARDPLQNYLVRIDFPEPIEGMTITAEWITDLEPINPLDFLVDPDAARYPFEYASQLRKELAPYRRFPHNDPGFRAWAAVLDRGPAYVVDFLLASMQQVRQGITVESSTDVAPVDLDAVLSTRRASPWALAWLSTLGLRDLGFAARFVGGYVVGEGGATVPVEWRAWTDVFLPGAGWVGMDPIVGAFVNESYLPVASAAEPQRALALVAEREVQGVRRVEVVRGCMLRPAERSSPHTGSQRREIEGVARQVETDLDRAGLSFSLQRDIAVVAGVAPDRSEWTYAAIGDDKLTMAQELLARLRARLAPSGAPLATQAQWHAGESLPRWKLMCVFRADGAPLWNRPDAVPSKM